MVKIRLIAVTVAILVVVVAGVASLVALNWIQPTSTTAIEYTYHVTAAYPHSTDAFTEGLVYDNGVLYESTGEYGTSYLRQVTLATGNVTKQVALSPSLYGEGLALVGDSLVQLTWKNNIGFVYDKETFALKENFSYSGEGWGLTYDGHSLIMSNGSSNLIFLNPTTHQKTGEVSVHDGQTLVTNLNELEYINGDIYANVWLQQKIVIINPQTGQVKGWIDLEGIYQPSSPNDVLNGIAHDAVGERLFVTGKNWPNLYEITITPKT